MEWKKRMQRNKNVGKKMEEGRSKKGKLRNKKEGKKMEEESIQDRSMMKREE